MTDRYCAPTVVLDKDIRSDDAEAIINAIKMVKHVLDVKPQVTGDVTIVTKDGRSTDNVLFESILEPVAEFIRSEKISKLESTDAVELLLGKK